MYNVISMPDDDDSTSRFPWRAIVIILLLLIAGGYGALVVRQAARQLRAAPHEEYLALAGPVAEAVEHHLADDTGGNPQLLVDLTAPLFAETRTLAAVRLWSPDHVLLAEVARPHPDTPHSDHDGTLPDLGARAAMDAIAAKLTDTAWTDPIAQLQLLENEQNTLSEQMQAADQGVMPKSVRMRFYQQQDSILAMAQSAGSDDTLLQATTDDMDNVFTALTLDDETALPKALDASDTVMADMTLALTQYRAHISAIAALPVPLAAAAPPPATCWQRYWPTPTLHGLRVLVPLFTPSTDSNLTDPAGYAEVICYTRPALLLDVLNWRRLIPSAACLLLALLLLCWPRKLRAA